MIFRQLNPAEFERCLLSWLGALHQTSAGHLLAIDGKTARQSFDKATARSALRMVSVRAVSRRLSIGCVAEDKKSNEITAIPEVLYFVLWFAAVLFHRVATIASHVAGRKGHSRDAGDPWLARLLWPIGVPSDLVAKFAIEPLMAGGTGWMVFNTTPLSRLSAYEGSGEGTAGQRRNGDRTRHHRPVEPATMRLPKPILSVLDRFRPEFRRPTWDGTVP